MDPGTISSWATVIITFVGVSSAVFQYVINSGNARAIKVADEVQALNDDESAQSILRLIEALAKRLRLAGCIYTTMRSQVALGGVTDLVGDLWVEFSAGAAFPSALGP